MRSRLESCSSLMACISCGVITSAWLWRKSSRCESAMLRCNIGPVLAYPFLGPLYTRSFYVVSDDVNSGSNLVSRLHPELFAEIQPPHFRVVDDVLSIALAQHFTRIDDVGAVRETKGLAHVVVGDENADAALFQVADEILDVTDGDRVDAGEGLVEQHVGRTRRQRARDLGAAPLTTGKRDRRRLAQPRDVEFLEQLVELHLALFLARLDDFEHRADIVLDVQAAENRGFLRQIADAEAGALIHRQMRDVVVLELDLALVCRDQS